MNEHSAKHWHDAVPVSALKFCLLVLMFLTSHAVIAETGNSAGKASGVPPDWVMRAQMGRVQLSSQPLEYTFAVKPQMLLKVAGSISLSFPTNCTVKAGILVLNFYDHKGDEIKIDELPYTPGLKGYFSYLKWTGGAGLGKAAEPFDVRVVVPECATLAKVRIAKWDKGNETYLTWFRCSVKDTLAVTRKLIAICLFIALAIGAFYVAKRMPDMNTSRSQSVFGGWYMLFNICICALVLIVAAVFFREAIMSADYMALPAASFCEYLLAVAMVAMSVYLLTCNRRKFAVVTIMLICFAIHFIVIRLTHALYSQTMVSDYLAVERCLSSPQVIVRHVDFYPYWVNFELLCSVLGKIFGPKLTVVQYLNASCATAAVYPVFKLCEKAAGFRMAIFTSVCMVLSPIFPVYGTILTGEYIAGMAYAYAMYFIVMTFSQRCVRKAVCSAFWSGCFLGVGQMVKPFAPLFWAAMVFLLIVDLLRHGWKNLPKLASAISLALSVYVLIACVANASLAGIANPASISHNNASPIVRTLLLGLNPQTGGRYDREMSVLIQRTDPDQQISMLKELVKSHYKEFPSLFLNKLNMMYADTSFGWGWYQQTIKPSHVPRWLKESMYLWNTIVLWLVALGLIGLFVSCLTAKENWNDNLVGVAASLVISAFTVLLLLVEVQSRYKMAIYPIFFLLIPYIGVWFRRENILYVWGMTLVKRLANGNLAKKNQLLCQKILLLPFSRIREFLIVRLQRKEKKG